MARSSGHPDGALLGSIGSNERWGRETDRTAATQPARDAFQQQFLAKAGGDPVRAENLRRAHYKRMSLRSAQVRRRKAHRQAADVAELGEAG